MTTISAPRATASLGPANPFSPNSPPTAHVRIPGTARTYEVRDVLRGMGLRWDPVSHAWHGTLPVEKGAFLGRQYGLKPQLVPTIEAFSAPIPEPKALAGPRLPARPPAPPHPHDFSRTRAEARVALPDADEDEEEIATPTRQFSLWEITSGLPDDSREADERAAKRRMRDLRGRVRAARAVVSSTPGLAQVLASDWRKAARFYARFGITESMCQAGVSRSIMVDESD